MPGMNLGLGLGLSPVIGAIKKWFLSDAYKADGFSPSLIADFANNRYAAKSVRTNYVYNSTFTGAVDINLPNMAWAGSQGGITREFIGAGTEDGMSYIDLRFRGTATNTNTHPLYFNNSSLFVPGVLGQIWTCSFYAKIIAGSVTNIDSISCGIDELNSAGSYLTASTTTIHSTISSSRQRFSHTRTLNNASTAKVTGKFQIRAVNGTAIDITIRLYAPQLENRSVATSYIPTSTGAVTVSSYEAEPFSDVFSFTRASTGTYFDSAGVMRTAAIDTRRLDHDPLTGEPLGILVEGQRTNYIKNSELFNNWTLNTGATVSVNTDTAPDGELTMDTVNMAASPYSGVYRFDLAAAVSTSYCFSMFVKNKSGGKKIKFGCDGSGPFGTSTAALAIFDTETLTFSSVGSAVTSYGYIDVGGGIYRIYVVATSTASASGNVTTPIFNGDGTIAASFAVWGYQLEIGSFPSSYIPTAGSAVTRSADNVTATSSTPVPFADWYNQTEGTFFIDWYVPYMLPKSGQLLYSSYLSSDKFNNRIYAEGSGSLYLRHSIFSGGALTSNIGAATALYSNSNIDAHAYKTDSSGLYRSGVSIGTDPTVVVPTCDKFSLGGLEYDFQLYGHVKEFRYYPIRVTNASLQELTT